MSFYSELLKSPLWQKKRLEILSRDNWQCYACHDEDEMLVVHHKYYDKEKMPWEYKNSAYITLCNTCHNQWHRDEKKLYSDIIENIKRSEIDILDFYEVSEAVRDVKLKDTQLRTIKALVHILSDEKAMLVILQLYSDLPIEKLVHYSLIKQ